MTRDQVYQQIALTLRYTSNEHGARILDLHAGVGALLVVLGNVSERAHDAVLEAVHAIAAAHVTITVVSFDMLDDLGAAESECAIAAWRLDGHRGIQPFLKGDASSSIRVTSSVTRDRAI